MDKYPIINLFHWSFQVGCWNMFASTSEGGLNIPIGITKTLRVKKEKKKNETNTKYILCL
jgi:hypothetical protein